MSIKLNKSEINIYNFLKDKKDISFEEITNHLNEQEDIVRRAIEVLKTYDIIQENTSDLYVYDLDKNGLYSLENGFIEEIFCDYLKLNETKVSDLSTLKINNLNNNEVSLAFGICKKLNIIDIKDGFLKVKPNYKEVITKQKEVLLNIKNNIFKKELELIFNELLKRKNFIIKKRKTIKKYSFKKNISYETINDAQLFLTSDDLKNKNFKNINLKPFDVQKLPTSKEMGRQHPLTYLMNHVKEIFIGMGFEEMSGPYVETCFWNMDSMFISQDHPARDIQDTFYLNMQGTLPKDKKFIETISELHKNGGNTGSLGHQYEWSEDVAKQLILRTHTTATTYRKFYELKDKKNKKFFSIGKIFRNESIDATHSFEFHQVEGFIIGDNLGLADLIGCIKSFLEKLGITKIKFKPTYNPYTEPSMECFGYLEHAKKWVEIVNSGVFRPESLAPYGINQSVIAWGFGFERLAMLIYQNDKKNLHIKDLHGDACNLDWLRKYKYPKLTFK